MAGYLLDTTTIIKHLRGDEKVTSYLYKIGIRGDIVGFCCINIAENVKHYPLPELEIKEI
ncbi:MAG: hypothetical protein H5T85_07350 [Actinobacteria bacterium]|nr:hypothetical protein [Actinomycetota bacterium]